MFFIENFFGSIFFYIVNINHIIHISGNAQGYRLNLTETTEEIPVSRTYLKNLKKLKDIIN